MSSSPPVPQSTSPTDASTFLFPPHYAFPPFFTLQPVLATRTSQLQSWSTLIQSYCRHHRLWTLILVDSLATPLFTNTTLSRSLSLRDARAIIHWMTTPEGGQRAEWIPIPSGNKKGKSGLEDEESKIKCWVYWRRPEEWASVIEEWVDRTAQKGTVLTLYEIVESDATRKEEFYGMDMELLKKCLGVSVKKGRAQVFGSEGSEGIKFF